VSSFLCRFLGLSGTFHWWISVGSVTARNLNQTSSRLQLIRQTATVTRLYLEIGQSSVAVKYHCQNTRMRMTYGKQRCYKRRRKFRENQTSHSFCSTARYSFIRVRRWTFRKRGLPFQSTEFHYLLWGQLQYFRPQIHTNMYTHHDTLFIHVAGFTRAIMPYLAGQCNCLHRQQSRASFREKIFARDIRRELWPPRQPDFKQFARSSSVGIVTWRCAVTILALRTI
jgi:hypothetical protein